MCLYFWKDYLKFGMRYLAISFAVCEKTFRFDQLKCSRQGRHQRIYNKSQIHVIKSELRVMSCRGSKRNSEKN